MFIKLHTLAQPNPVILMFLCTILESSLWGICVCVCVDCLNTTYLCMCGVLGERRSSEGGGASPVTRPTPIVKGPLCVSFPVGSINAFTHIRTYLPYFPAFRLWGTPESYSFSLRGILSLVGIHHALVLLAEIFRALLVCRAVDAGKGLSGDGEPGVQGALCL